MCKLPLYYPDFDSIVHLPAPGPGASQVDAPCRVLSFHGNRLALLTDRYIPLCAPLTVEHDDALYLGEVVKSPVPPLTADVSLNHARYHIEVVIEQVLSGLQSLVTSRARLLDEQERGGRTDRRRPTP
jgi:hypothetical protein